MDYTIRLFTAAFFTIFSLSQPGFATTVKNKPINWTKSVTTYSKVKSWTDFSQLMFVTVSADYQKDIRDQILREDLQKERLPGLKIDSQALQITQGGKTVSLRAAMTPQNTALVSIDSQEVEIKFQSAAEDLAAVQKVLDKKSAIYQMLIPSAQAGGMSALVFGLMILAAVAAGAYLMPGEVNVAQDFLKKMKSIEIENFDCQKSSEEGLQLQMKGFSEGKEFSFQYNSKNSNPMQGATGSLLYPQSDGERYEVIDGKIKGFAADKSALGKLIELSLKCCDSTDCRQKAESSLQTPASGPLSGVQPSTTKPPVPNQNLISPGVR